MGQNSPGDAVDELAAQITGPQWTFAVEVYGREGVGAACLDLQDRRNVDVTVLLMAAYAWAVLERDLDASDIAHLDAQVRDWRETVVVPLRAVRRNLKSLVVRTRIEPAQRFRDKVKALELESEQIQLAFLAERLSGMGQAGTADRSGLAGKLRDVLAFYSPGEIEQADRAAIDVISRAVTGYVARRPAGGEALR